MIGRKGIGRSCTVHVHRIQIYIVGFLRKRDEEEGGRKRGMKESGEIARTWKKEKKRMMMVIPQQSEGHDEHVSPASQCKSPHTPVYKN